MYIKITFSITVLSFRKLRLLLSPIVKDTAQNMENVNTVTLVIGFLPDIAQFSEVFIKRKSIFNVVLNKSLILNFRLTYQRNIKVSYW